MLRGLAHTDAGVREWAARLAGGAYGVMHDRVNVAAMMFGGGPAGAGLKGLAWMAIKQGAINAGAEAVTQPFVQSWRKRAGLSYGLDQAALNVGSAALFGAGLDATVRGAVRGVRRNAERSR